MADDEITAFYTLKDLSQHPLTSPKLLEENFKNT